MPKKAQPNAFYFFMKELEPKLRREGRIINGMADVVPIASPQWKLLDKKEKERFEEMAAEYKRRMKGTQGDMFKLDNIGNIIGQRKDKFEEMEKKRQQERIEAKSAWPPGKDLVNQDFYVVHFNTLCMTDDGICLPCEVGLVEYSMKDGIKRVYHTFIDPGSIPIGYRRLCQVKSEETHQIPVSDFELKNDNYRGILIQMENFVNQDGNKETYPPLYCKAKDIEETESSLAYIHGKATVGRPLMLKKVYELEGLIVDIYQHVGKNMSRSFVVDMLTSNIFDYNSEVQCEWHAEKDVKFCSLGNARRYTYHMSDNLCDVYEFKLTKNHLPDRTAVTENITVLFEPKPECLSSRSRTSTPQFSNMSTPRETTPRPDSTTFKGVMAPTVFPARDVRYGDQSKSSAASETTDDDARSDVSSSVYTPRSGGQTPYNMSPMRSSIPTPSSQSSGYGERGSSRGAAASDQSAPWLKTSIPVSGVGRGTPITTTGGFSHPFIKIAPPGAAVDSIFPLPREPGMKVHRGRGWAPPKDVS